MSEQQTPEETPEEIARRIHDEYFSGDHAHTNRFLIIATRIISEVIQGERSAQDAAVQAEREACAKVADEKATHAQFKSAWWDLCNEIAAAILARAEAKGK